MLETSRCAASPSQEATLNEDTANRDRFNRKQHYAEHGGALVRPATGSPRFMNGVWHARLHVDGRRVDVPMVGFVDPTAVEAAKAEALNYVRIAAGKALKLPDAQGESVRAFSERWLTHRATKQIDYESDVCRLRPHIWPFFEGRTMASVTKRDIERFVQMLDEKISSTDAKNRIAPRTAQNIWAVLSKMFHDAVNSKNLSLRVLESNPVLGVEGPDKDGAKKELAYLYPEEFLQLVECEAVDLDWRRAVALLVYLGLRPGELRALKWSDVDLLRCVVHVQRSEHRLTGELKSTKTGSHRTVAIEPALMPLLVTMKSEATGERVVARLGCKSELSRKLRSSLETAGCKRRELFESTATSLQMRGYDLRGTYATWRAVRSDSPYAIRDALGHTNTKTTDIYVRRVQHLLATFGVVFPVLPASLVSVTNDDTNEAEQSLEEGELAVVLDGKDEKLLKKRTTPTGLEHGSLVFKRFETLPKAYAARTLATGDDDSAHPSLLADQSQDQLNDEHSTAQSDAVTRLSALLVRASQRRDFATVHALTTAIEALVAGSYASPAPAVNGPSASPLKLS